jgi:hypothetical protein
MYSDDYKLVQHQRMLLQSVFTFDLNMTLKQCY